MPSHMHAWTSFRGHVNQNPILLPFAKVAFGSHSLNVFCETPVFMSRVGLEVVGGMTEPEPSVSSAHGAIDVLILKVGGAALVVGNRGLVELGIFGLEKLIRGFRYSLPVSLSKESSVSLGLSGLEYAMGGDSILFVGDEVRYPS